MSGASTLTQQLARTLQPRPRTLRGKAGEAVLALRMELSLGKNVLLEQYVNRVDFGPNVRGIGAASRLYFDKPAGALSVAEAATLVGMVRGPSLYDPTKNPHLAHVRRDRVLRRAERAGLLPARDVARALAEPLRLQQSALEEGGRHFLRALRLGCPGLPRWVLAGGDEFKTSLDLKLTDRSGALGAPSRRPSRRTTMCLRRRWSVLDNRSGDVLAYVGSAGFFDQRSLGQKRRCAGASATRFDLETLCLRHRDGAPGLLGSDDLAGHRATPGHPPRVTIDPKTTMADSMARFGSGKHSPTP